MVEIIIAGVTGISLGVYLGLKYANHIFDKEISKNIKDMDIKVSKTFNDIFDNMKNVIFSKRVNNYVYLISGTTDILIDLKLNMIYLTNNGQFITDSRYLDKNYSNKLLVEINTIFYTDINDVVVCEGFIVSKNISSISFEQTNINENEDEDEECVIEFDEKYIVDMILDKITEFGISSLNDDEIEFLKTQSK